MKLIFISLLFYIEAIFYEALIYVVMKMRYDRCVTAFLARVAERKGERLHNMADFIEEAIGNI